MTDVEAVLQTLAAHELKLTPQRRRVVEVFFRHPGEHLSADDVYAEVRQQNPEVGLATIYRTLDLLSDLGVLDKLELGDGRARYELDRGTGQRHLHLVCTACGRVEEFQPDALLAELEAEIGRRTGFRISDRELKFYGLCADCRERRREAGR
ncbi:MAG: transcriptional repressor [Clostridia bacterium]|nr:transcriptional repressor [Clostridia bacterium]MCL6521221.1 transcriptional repressor [Bacillota bacterium]